MCVDHRKKHLVVLNGLSMNNIYHIVDHKIKKRIGNMQPFFLFFVNRNSDFVTNVIQAQKKHLNDPIVLFFFCF
jgi:hypothetical protein